MHWVVQQQSACSLGEGRGWAGWIWVALRPALLLAKRASLVIKLSIIRMEKGELCGKESF